MGDEFPRPHVAHLLARQVPRLPAQGHQHHQEARPRRVVRCGFSYLWAAVKPKGKEETFEDWVSNRFGKRLFTTSSPTPRRSGASSSRNGAPTGRLSGSGPSPPPPPRPRSSATRTKHDVHQSSSTRGTARVSGDHDQPRIEEMGGEAPNSPKRIDRGRPGRRSAAPQGTIEPRGSRCRRCPLRHMVGLSPAEAPRRGPARRPGPALPRLHHTVALVVTARRPVPNYHITRKRFRPHPELPLRSP